MRTAIYVLQPTSVRISTTDARDVGARLCKFVVPGPSSPVPEPVSAAGTHSLPRGIYAVHTLATVHVTGEHVTVERHAADKDSWPDPPPPLLELVAGATPDGLAAFLASIAKMIDD